MADYGIPLLVAVYCAGFYSLLFTARFPPAHSIVSLLLIGCGSIGLVLLWHGASIVASIKNGSGDSFYRLDLAERLGLATVSIALMAFLFWLSALKSKSLIAWSQAKTGRLVLGIAIDIPVTLILFVLLYGLSPQIYYTYYQLIIPGLPFQWVPVEFVDFDTLSGFISINGKLRFSELLSALTFWVLGLNVIWQYLANSSSENLTIRGRLCAMTFGVACFIWGMMFRNV